MANEKLAYRDCQVTKHLDGMYEVYGGNLLDSGITIRDRNIKTIEEVHQAVDDAYKAAQANRDQLAAYGVEAVEAHNKVAELDALTRQHGKQTIEMAAKCGAALARAKSLLKHGQWLPWLEKNCPHITDQTARNYIKVANALNNNSKPLLNCGSLMEAYVVLGIVSLRPKPKKPTTENPKGGDENKNKTPPAKIPPEPEVTAETLSHSYAPEMLCEAVVIRLNNTDTLHQEGLQPCLKSIKPIVDWYNHHAPKPRKAKKSKKSRLEKAAESVGNITLDDQPEKVVTA